MKQKLGIILIFVLLLAVAVGAVFLWFLPVPRVNDMTAENTAVETPSNDGAEENNGAGSAEEENEVVLSSTVITWLDDDAKAINNAIQSIYCNESDQMEIKLDRVDGDILGQLGKGDIFLLDGDTNSPFGGAYIGKVVSYNEAKDGTVTLVTETPYMDEVFDAVSINVSGALTEESITSIFAMDGVEVNYLGQGTNDTDAAAATPMSAPAKPQYKAVRLGNANSGGSTDTPKATENSSSDKNSVFNVSFENGLCAEFNIDLMKAISATKTMLSTTDMSLAGEDENLSENRDLASESTKEMVVNDLIDSFNKDPTLTLSGSLSLTDITYDLVAEWNIGDFFDKWYGFTDLSYALDYNFSADATLKLGAKDIKFGGSKTQFKISESLKLQGLNDKLIPLLGVQFTPAGPALIKGADGNAINSILHINGGQKLLSAAIIFYIDISGNVSAALTVDLSYQMQSHSGSVFVRGGEWVGENQSSEIPDYAGGHKDLYWSVDFSMKADMDAHMGISFDLYIMNINILDANLFKFGVEGQGVGGFRITSLDNRVDAYADWYARVYLKVIDVYVKIKGTLQTDLLKVNAAYSKHFLLADFTLAETGRKKDTHYDFDTMSTGLVTAEDSDYIYYLNENDCIIKQSKETGASAELYRGSISRFCGIDESYLYILKPGESWYDIHRIDKQTGINRVFQSDVVAVLAQDENNLYYLESANESAIQALNRGTWDNTTFCAFDDEVQVMTSYGDNYYVTTKKEDMFSWLFGATNYYYIIDSDGNVISELGSNPGAMQLPRTASAAYYSAAKYVERQILRYASASNIYWIAADMSEYIDTDNVSGWLQDEAGIFVTLNNQDPDAAKTFTIWLYRAEDGQKVEIADVASNQAFFTLCQDSAGQWHFIDEGNNYLTLYKMDSNFGNLQEEAIYSKEDLGVSLTECSLEIVDNKAVFYSISEDTESAYATTIFRYDLY